MTYLALSHTQRTLCSGIHAISTQWHKPRGALRGLWGVSPNRTGEAEPSSLLSLVAFGRRVHSSLSASSSASLSATKRLDPQDMLARRLAEMEAGGMAAHTLSQTLKPTIKPQPQPQPQANPQTLPSMEHTLSMLAKTRAPAPANVLTDTFGRKHTYLRISLTERCNLRCQYCMPEEGIKLAADANLLSADEIVRVAQLFVAAGVNKIRLTGGEPTVRKDLLQLTQRLGALAGLQTLAITTNGLVLSRQVAALQRAGLNAVNISLDTLVPAKFELLTRRKGHDRVMHSIERALEVGVESVKVNVVLMRGINDDEINDFVDMTRNKKLNVRFIEYMPFDGNAWETKKMVSYREMKSSIEARFGKLTRLNDSITEVAKNYTVPGFAGSVSFITSMTEHFCGGCNRLRIMADGNLKVCLFGPAEVSLRDAMRAGATDEQLKHIVAAAVTNKKEGHADPQEIAATKNRPMIQIGG